LVSTQAIINRKHLGWQGLKDVARLAAGLALKGQTNFLRMLWKFNSVYNADRQYSDHFRETRYQMRPPNFAAGTRPRGDALYIHNPRIQAAEAATRRANGRDSHPSPGVLTGSESFEQSGNS
jgi:hopanoid C-3 methylase